MTSTTSTSVGQVLRYARVSTGHQSLDAQALGMSRHTDKASGITLIEQPRSIETPRRDETKGYINAQWRQSFR
jgi:hypothetical protein